MRKIVLISQPEPKVIEVLQKEVFTNKLQGKRFAYMPCEGNHPNNDKYTPFWKEKVEAKGGKFRFIDNSKSHGDSGTERTFVESTDYLMAPGGNTFYLLNNLRRSGLFDSIKRFFTRESYCYLGMSAGAIILGPTIEYSAREGFEGERDENDVGLTDLTGLEVIDFEPAVHFDPDKDANALEEYRKTTKHEVKPIRNDEALVIMK